MTMMKRRRITGPGAIDHAPDPPRQSLVPGAIGARCASKVRLRRKVVAPRRTCARGRKVLRPTLPLTSPLSHLHTFIPSYLHTFRPQAGPPRRPDVPTPRDQKLLILPEPALNACHPAPPKLTQLGMYQGYYGLSEMPFNITPDPKFLYLS